jgi:hypothetical protein
MLTPVLQQANTNICQSLIALLVLLVQPLELGTMGS